FLDGKLVHDVSYPTLKALYAVASRTRDAREAILKVVNASDEQQDTQIHLNGATLGSSATVTTLCSASAQDENSLEQPTKVAPVTRDLSCGGSDLKLSFPGNSVTVVRMRIQ